MSEHSKSHNPIVWIAIFIVLALIVLWFGTASVTPGGAMTTHLVACGSDGLTCGMGNATASEVPVGQSPTNWYDISGGVTTEFSSIYTYLTIFAGLFVIAGLAGFVIWFAEKGKHRHE